MNTDGYERQQAAYWNAKAGNKKFTLPLDYELFNKYVKPGSRILDFGCGYGRILEELAGRGFIHLYGADFSEKMIEAARCAVPTAELKVNNDLEIPFATDVFDCVILLAVLTCIYDDRSQDKLLAEIRRVLKPGGIVYIGDFMLNSDLRNLDRYEKFREQFPYGVFVLEDGGILRHHSEERVRRFGEKFVELEFIRTSYTTMNGHISNGFYWIGKSGKGGRL